MKKQNRLLKRKIVGNSIPHSYQLMGHLLSLPPKKNQARNIKVKWHFISNYLNFPNTVKYTFFSAGHGIFSTIDHIIGHKASVSRYKKIDI